MPGLNGSNGKANHDNRVLLAAVTYLQLQQQLEDPQHVYIQLKDGKYIRHVGPRAEFEELTFKRGERIRFTRLAAERLLRGGGFLYKGARMVLCLDDEG